MAGSQNWVTRAVWNRLRSRIGSSPMWAIAGFVVKR